jgi:enoyl-CoA hydratase/carnithine racemase
VPNDLVLIERADRIATISFNNPPVNAITVKMLDAFNRALDEVEADKTIRCVILTGAGEKAFCAGGDLREEAQFRDPQAATYFREYGRKTLNRIEAFPRPIVAAIHGYCIGGGTALGWVCDIRIAADNSVFRAGDAYLGLIPSWGMGLLRLPRLLGRNRALDVLLIGENFGAETARELGLVTRVVPKDKVQQEARAVAMRIAQASPAAILATRKAVSYNMRRGWDEMVAYEEELCKEIAAHPDSHEGIDAFFQKRAANFKDS